MKMYRNVYQILSHLKPVIDYLDDITRSAESECAFLFIAH